MVTVFLFFFFKNKRKRNFSPRTQRVCLVKRRGKELRGRLSLLQAFLQCGVARQFSPLLSPCAVFTHLIPCRYLKSERLEQGSQSLISVIFGRTYPKAWCRVSIPLLATQIEIFNFSQLYFILIHSGSCIRTKTIISKASLEQPILKR